MAARKHLQNAPSDEAKQKQKETDVKLRMECARVVVQLQTAKTNVDDLTRLTHTLFQYIKTGAPVEKI